jgi:hypothetical protein
MSNCSIMATAYNQATSRPQKFRFRQNACSGTPQASGLTSGQCARLNSFPSLKHLDHVFDFPKPLGDASRHRADLHIVPV